MRQTTHVVQHCNCKMQGMTVQLERINSRCSCIGLEEPDSQCTTTRGIAMTT